jgi:hypothetical protein
MSTSELFMNIFKTQEQEIWMTDRRRTLNEPIKLRFQAGLLFFIIEKLKRSQTFASELRKGKKGKGLR